MTKRTTILIEVSQNTLYTTEMKNKNKRKRDKTHTYTKREREKMTKKNM